MRRLLTLAALILASCGVRPVYAACSSGYISIVDPFQLPNGQAWTGSIVYTLAYNTTVAGATVVNARQQFNVTNGINICLAPGLYTPVTLNQSGFNFSVTQSWGVPSTGGPYTVAQIQGTINLGGGAQGPAGPTGATGPAGPQGPTGATGPAGGLLLSSTVTWTRAQVLALNTVCQALVPALGANQIIVPVRIVIQQTNAFYTSMDEVMDIAEGTCGANTVVGDFGPWTDSGDAKYIDSYFFPGTLNANYTAYANETLIAFATDPITEANGTGGSVYVTTWYYAFTVQ